MDHSQVIIRPVVSEKSYVLATAEKYTFRVHDKAHKTQIKQAVEALFDVNVVEVRTSKVPSKPKRRGVTAATEIRRRDPHVPILLVTGHAGADRTVLARVGADELLEKPFSPTHLLAVLRRLTR